MAQMISLSIDLTAVKDSGKVVKHEKNGRSYVEITVSVNDEKNQYGKDVSAWIGQTKEERERKDSRQFCGGGKVIWSGGNTPHPKQQTANWEPPQVEEDLPF